MKYQVRWATAALADREAIFRYLYREAGCPVATQTDEKFVAMSRLLAEQPQSGVVISGNDKRRRLTLSHLPFIMVYAISAQQISILRLLHSSRKVSALYR